MRYKNHLYKIFIRFINYYYYYSSENSVEVAYIDYEEAYGDINAVNVGLY